MTDYCKTGYVGDGCDLADCSFVVLDDLADGDD